jgi:SAM-dependent methyltransferase
LYEAKLAPGSIDLAYSISVIEHLGVSELHKTLDHLKRLLKPGGLFVATVDLFLNLAPFTTHQTNQWGTNVSVASLVEASGLTLIKGNRKELFGYPEFDPDRVLAHLEDYYGRRAISEPRPSIHSAKVGR